MGMSLSDFWQMTPRMFHAVQEGFKQRLFFEQQRANDNAWLQGVYFQNAVASVLDKRSKYPKDPFKIAPPMTPEEKVAYDKERLIARLNAFAEAHNAKWAREHPEG